MVLFGYTVIKPVKFTKGCVNMFNNYKRRFGEKGKRAAALLAAAALLCGLTGCSKSETGSSAPLSSSSVPQSVPADKSEVSQSPEINSGNNSVTSTSQSTPVEESKDSQSSEVNSDNSGSSGTQSEQNSNQSKFDFDEAVKNTTLFNSNVDLPCTIRDFGEDFSLDSEIMVSNEEIGVVSVSLLYKGRMIGMANLSAYNKEEVQSGGENMQIVQICLGDDGIDIDDPDRISEFWENSQIDLDMQGICFTSSYDDILYRWGKPDCEYSTTSKLRLVYGKKDLQLESGKNYIEIDIIDERIASIFISAYNI